MKQWLLDLSIKYKISIIAFIGIIGFLTFFLIDYRLSERVQGELEKTRNAHLPTINFINELSLTFSQIEKLYQASLIENDIDTLNEAEYLVEDLLLSFDKALDINEINNNSLKRLQRKLMTYTNLASMHISSVIMGNDLTSDASINGFAKLNILRTEYEAMQRSFIMKWFDAYREKMIEIQKAEKQNVVVGLVIGFLVGSLLIIASFLIIRLITNTITRAVSAANNIANGELDQAIMADANDETGQLMESLSMMKHALAEQYDTIIYSEHLQSHLSNLNENLRGDKPLEELADTVLRFLVKVTNSCLGTFLIAEEDELYVYASYGHLKKKNIRSKYTMDEAQLGECIKEKKIIVLDNVSDSYLMVSSTIGQSKPAAIALIPILYEEEIVGVIELGGFNPYGKFAMEFLEKSIEGIGIAINSSESRLRMADMLEQTKQQAKELKEQQGKMEEINKTLESQRDDILQKNEVMKRNYELEESKKLLLARSAALEESNKYKTEFLSTMSHELRTPLNSILILSQALMDNRSDHLSEKEIKHAKVINSSGRDLLNLINDILDLSKVEAGKIELVYEQVALQNYVEDLKNNFQYVANDKGLEFDVTLDENLPEMIYSDSHRMNQILKNFVSNAIKFTEEGGVYINIAKASEDTNTISDNISINMEDAMVISVKDTGAGIPESKQQLIFEAFKQADGTTSRRYGGTGLGLTISRKLANLLKGEIQVSSEGEGKGSTFSLILPMNCKKVKALESQENQKADSSAILREQQTPFGIQLSNDAFTKAKPVDRLLIVEDDINFASILNEMITEADLTCDVVNTGQDALTYLENYLPSAVILDISLPDISGWRILSSLKQSTKSGGIPVHIITALPEKKHAMELGADNFIEKPVSENTVQNLLNRIKSEIEGVFRKVLLIEDDTNLHDVIYEQFKSNDTDLTIVENGKEGLSSIGEQDYDCLIIDLNLPDYDGMDLLKKIRTSPEYAVKPIIIFTAEDLSPEKELELNKYCDRIIIKSDGAMERLVQATEIFLESIVENNRKVKQQIHHVLGDIMKQKEAPINNVVEENLPDNVTHIDELEYVQYEEGALDGVTVLLVDDDIRNIYSTTSILEASGMHVIPAMSGKEAIEKLESDFGNDINLILMDIMMPEMDGCDAIRHIRKLPQNSHVPIIALTAKAMKEDRDKCLSAGANDYLSKPVDIDKLNSLLTTWSKKSQGESEQKSVSNI